MRENFSQRSLENRYKEELINKETYPHAREKIFRILP
jgi:hypothetical protein